MKNKNFKVAVTVILLLLFVVAAGIFAYWAKEVIGSSTKDDGRIDFSDGYVVTTLVNANQSTTPSGLLEPAKYANTPGGIARGAVDRYVFKWDVSWSEDGTDFAEGHQGNLNVSVINVKAGTNDLASNLAALLNFDFSDNNVAIILKGNSVEIILTVTMNAPADQAEFKAFQDALGDGTNRLPLTLEVQFTVTP
jgi:hypothetical protein